jgi:hypothetical protein
VAIALLRLGLPADFIDDVEDQLAATLANEYQTIGELRDNLKKQLARLEVTEERLLDLAETDSLPQAKIRMRLSKLTMDRQRLSRNSTRRMISWRPVRKSSAAHWTCSTRRMSCTCRHQTQSRD